MKKLSGAEMVVQSLRDEGVEYFILVIRAVPYWIFMMQSILLVGLSIF